MYNINCGKQIRIILILIIIIIHCPIIPNFLFVANPFSIQFQIRRECGCCVHCVFIFLIAHLRIRCIYFTIFSSHPFHSILQLLLVLLLLFHVYLYRSNASNAPIDEMKIINPLKQKWISRTFISIEYNMQRQTICCEYKCACMWICLWRNHCSGISFFFVYEM